MRLSPRSCDPGAYTCKESELCGRRKLKVFRDVGKKLGHSEAFSRGSDFDFA